MSGKSKTCSFACGFDKSKTCSFACGFDKSKTCSIACGFVRLVVEICQTVFVCLSLLEKILLRIV